MARFNLAYWFGRAGDAVAARGPVRRTAPNPRAHVWPGPLRHLGRAGRTRLLDGVRRGCRCRRDQFAALLSSYEGVLGPEHPETLAIWYQLAHWTALAVDEAATQD